MNTTSNHPSHLTRDVFVVRRWRSPVDDLWRGQIVHVGSGQTACFNSDDELLAYVKRHLQKQTDESKIRGLR